MKARVRIIDQWVRLGLAVAVIALVSLALYQFGGRAGAFTPGIGGIHYPQQ